MSKTPHPNSYGRCGLALALCLCFASLGMVEPVLAQPAQVPLTSSSTAPPQPNVMVMIDDSGSMASDAVPEGNFTLNGYTVYQFFQDYETGAFPGDPYLPNNGITASKDSVYETILQKKYRSPDVNRLFYSPNVLYSPWWSATTDASGQLTRMPASVPSKAIWEPVLKQTSYYDLTKNTPAVAGSAAVYGWVFSRGRWRWVVITPAVPAQPDFNPGIYYILKPGANPEDLTSYDRYDVNTSNSSPYVNSTPPASRKDCSSTGCTQAQELQNFANWFTYYRTRILMTKGSVIETYYNFQNQIRTGWGSINSNSSRITNLNKIQRGMGQLDLAYLKTLISDVGQISPNYSTPLRFAVAQVGEYFKTDAPWRDDLTDAGSTKSSACRRSANVLMTDGYYNDTEYDSDSSAVGNVDGGNGPDHSAANPAGYKTTQYKAQPPYSDTYANTLADVAMKYYVDDLQPNIENRVKPTPSDIAFWQHLTQYTVGVGVRGTLDASSTAAKKATLAAISAGAPWPDPRPSTWDTNPEKIDDLWHAAVDTGGDYFAVSSPTELTSALNDAFRAAVQAPLSEGGVAVSANTLVTGSLKLVPWFTAGTWTGELNAYAAYTVNQNLTFPTTPTWSAVPFPASSSWQSRNLYTWDGKGSVKFNATDLGTLQATVGAVSLTDYIRGDTSNEGVGPTQYRVRNGHLLGDFVDSAPVYVKDLVDLGYANIDSGYVDYVKLKAQRGSSLVFQGGNAGILHAFDGGTGVEKYGYLPKAGLPNLYLIAQQNYGTDQKNYHQFFVDGPLVETDAFISTKRSPSAAAWSNLILGSMGAGGTGIFALHVDTSDPAGTLDANTLLWEKSSADIANLGNVYSPMVAGKLQGTGGWVALVGNGAFSSGGVASLLVLSLTTGDALQEVVVDNAGGNGLMGVTPLLNKNGEIVAAYAGDLKGNLWRFDFDAQGKVAVGFGDKPLFTALGSGSGQAITAAPQWVSNPAGKGRIVVFGTGRLLSTADSTSTQRQSLYGVLDPTADGASAVGAVSPFNGLPDGRTLLAARTADTTAKVTTGGTSYYGITGNPIDWTTQKGWYMDLPFPDPPGTAATQREVYPVVILEGAFALFQTVVPPGAAAECDSASGTGYNYLLEAATGLPSSTPTFDTNHNDVIDAGDAPNIGGFSTKADGSDKVVKIMDCAGTGKCPDDKILYGDTSSEGMEKMAITKPKVNPPIVKDRVWRRIMNPPL